MAAMAPSAPTMMTTSRRTSNRPRTGACRAVPRKARSIPVGENMAPLRRKSCLETRRDVMWRLLKLVMKARDELARRKHLPRRFTAELIGETRQNSGAIGHVVDRQRHVPRTGFIAVIEIQVGHHVRRRRVRRCLAENRIRIVAAVLQGHA